MFNPSDEATATILKEINDEGKPEVNSRATKKTKKNKKKFMKIEFLRTFLAFTQTSPHNKMHYPLE